MFPEKAQYPPEDVWQNSWSEGDTMVALSFVALYGLHINLLPQFSRLGTHLFCVYVCVYMVTCSCTRPGCPSFSSSLASVLYLCIFIYSIVVIELDVLYICYQLHVLCFCSVAL